MQAGKVVKGDPAVEAAMALQYRSAALDAVGSGMNRASRKVEIDAIAAAE